MEIDHTSMFFEASIDGASATCSWATSVGQSKSKGYKFKNDKPGLVSFIIGLNYKIYNTPENEELDTKEGSDSRERLYFSLFDIVFINGVRVENTKFIILLVKEHSKSHDGRILISYPNYAEVKKGGETSVSNKDAMKKMAEIINCSKGCWFVHDITIKNQDELHFSAIVVHEEPKIYSKSQMRKKEWDLLVKEKSEKENAPINKIYFGAPGTGKSFKISDDLKQKNVDKCYQRRVTFHPDYDNASFLGAYQPLSNDNEISYQFVPQIFTNVFVDACKDPNNQYYLIIEEINRGNCSEIFGEIFHLLDRNDEYPITPSEELKRYLKGENIDSKFYKDGAMLLPDNISILATMNTSDQSLYPMDSAFKRRWDWEYIPINYVKDEKNESAKYFIKIGKKKVKWIEFIKSVNDKISKDPNLGIDKCLGNYFIKPETNNKIAIDSFINKVIFYLWNDVFKDEPKESIFGEAFLKDNENLTFESFFPIEKGKINLKKIFQKLNIMPKDPQGDENKDEDQ